MALLNGNAPMFYLQMMLFVSRFHVFFKFFQSKIFVVNSYSNADMLKRNFRFI